MSELMRFRVARAPQRRIPAPDSVVPVYLDALLTRVVVTLLQSMSQSSNPQGVVAAYVNGPKFVTRGATLSTLVPQLDVWLTTHGNEPTIKDLVSFVGDAATLVKSQPYKDDRLRIGDSLVAAAFSPIMPEARGYLTRLMLVCGLLELLASQPGRFKHGRDVLWAVQSRTVLFPAAFLELSRRLRAVMARRPGFTDYYVVRKEWIRYEAGEIAHIENVLSGERKERTHLRIDETEQTLLMETERTEVNQRDTQSTDRYELHDEAVQDTDLAAHIDGKVDTSGQYGPTKVDTHLGGSLDYSVKESESRAITQAHETIVRAQTRVEERVREVRTSRSLTRIEETNKHLLSNEGKNSPIAGVYRWVDKIQRLQIFRYPHRFILEFEVPDPAAFRLWLAERNKYKGVNGIEPAPFTVDGTPQTLQLTAADVDETKYLQLAARYGAMGVTAAPVDQVVSIAMVKDSPDIPKNDKEPIKFYLDKTVAVPSGYKAVDWNAMVFAFQNGWAFNGGVGVSVAVGSGDRGWAEADHDQGLVAALSGSVGDTSAGSIPVEIITSQTYGFTANVNVRCVPLDSTKTAWKIAVYEQILDAYRSLKRQFEEELASKSVQEGVIVSGDSDTRNQQTIREELKKHVITMLMGSTFKGRPAVDYTKSPPEIDLNKAASTASEIQFIEQAFEWENLTYVLYPYFWSGQDRWENLAALRSSDPDYAEFLRSGSARVVVSARPGFEQQVQIYAQFGILWGGGPIPAVDDPEYVSVVEEIKTQGSGSDGGIPGKSWEIRLPTSLVWLENDQALPSNPKPTLDAPSATAPIL